MFSKFKVWQNGPANLGVFLNSYCLLGGRGKPLHCDTKELVFRIHEYFESECEDAKCGRPLFSVTIVWERTTKATRLSRSVVGKILREKRTNASLVPSNSYGYR